MNDVIMKIIMAVMKCLWMIGYGGIYTHTKKIYKLIKGIKSCTQRTKKKAH